MIKLDSKNQKNNLPILPSHTHIQCGQAGEQGVPLRAEQEVKQGRCPSKMTKVAFTPATARLIIYHFKQESLTLAASPQSFPPAALAGPLFTAGLVQVLNLTVSSIKNKSKQLVALKGSASGKVATGSGVQRRRFKPEAIHTFPPVKLGCIDLIRCLMNGF